MELLSVVYQHGGSAWWLSIVVALESTSEAHLQHHGIRVALKTLEILGLGDEHLQRSFPCMTAYNSL